MILNRDCPHCGQPILEGSLFCLDCGARILGGAGTAGGRRLTGVRVSEPVGFDDIEDLPSGHYLFVLEGLDKGRRFDLIGGEAFIIGREEADVCLTDPFVSRAHAEIRRDDRRWRLRDYESTNGSLINDMPVAGQELVDGDIIGVGYTTLVFRVKE